MTTDTTPAQRAWDTYRFLRDNPDLWAQDTYGRVDADGEQVGCFAHWLVRRAGYELDTTGTARAHLADLPFDMQQRLPAQVSYAYDTEPPTVFVWDIADDLLGASAHDLFNPDHNLADLHAELTHLFGPDPDEQ